MAKPRTPNQKKRYTALNKRLAKYVVMVQSIYDSLSLEAASIVKTMTDYDADTEHPFRFKDYPLTKNRVNDLMRYFSHDLQALIYAGTTEEWKQSNLVQDLLANDVLKVYGMKRNGERVKRYYQPNNDALKAFQKRKDKGLTVSQKVWNQSYNFKRELEYAISSGIEKGQSAITLSKRISKYLHDFPALQADYKEKYGTATDCQNCEYRSIRLARSEINIAYRTAEQTRWQQMDFIKGYEIKLSHSHVTEKNGMEACELLADIYPKWFKWVGWHPNCRCICIPIVMTDDEWYSGNGQEITELPDNLKAWLHDNGERIVGAEERGTLPYWIKDNQERLSEPLHAARKSAEGIQMSRKARNIVINSLGKEDIPTFKSEQEENHRVIEDVLKTKKQPYMSFEKADSGNGNSLDDGTPAFRKNCQCCVVAHELRRRGFDVTAMGNTGTSFYKQFEDDTAMGWLTRKGKEIKVNNIKSDKDDEDDLYKKLMKQLSSGGRYTIEWDYKIKDLEGHIVCSEMINGNLVIYDPQRNDFWSLREILGMADISAGIGILRVDGLLINPSYIKSIVTTP